MFYPQIYYLFKVPSSYFSFNLKVDLLWCDSLSTGKRYRLLKHKRVWIDQSVRTADHWVNILQCFYFLFYATLGPSLRIFVFRDVIDLTTLLWDATIPGVDFTKVVLL